MRFRWLVATAGLAAAIGTTVASPSASAAMRLLAARRRQQVLV